MKAIQGGNPWQKLLIVDDEEDIVEQLGYHFQQLGFQIVEAFDGVEAVLSVIHQPDIDVVLMDIRMPVMDGKTATRQIKKRSGRSPATRRSGLPPPKFLR